MLIDLLKEAEELYDPETVALLRKYHRRAIHLEPLEPGKPSKLDPVPGCWFGGEPSLPADIPWPVYRYDGYDFPMEFCLQIDCARMLRLEEYPFPEHGTLFFFYEFSLQWERLYNMSETHLGGAVLYVEGDVSSVQPRPRPPMPVQPDAVDLYKLNLSDETPFIDPEYGLPREANWNRRTLPKRGVGTLVIGSFSRAGGSPMYRHAVGELLEALQRTEIAAKTNDEDYPLHRIFGVDDTGSRHDSDKVLPLLQLDPECDMYFINHQIGFLIEKSNLANRLFSECYVADGPYCNIEIGER